MHCYQLIKSFEIVRAALAMLDFDVGGLLVALCAVTGKLSVNYQ